MALISAYRTDTGQKVEIPDSWIGHPVLGKKFRKTPRQRAADQKKAPTAGETTEKEK